jgi:hypothetical protein
VSGDRFEKLSKREASKVSSKAGSRHDAVEGGYLDERRSATRASFSHPKYLVGGKPSHGSEFVILSSVPYDGAIC